MTAATDAPATPPDPYYYYFFLKPDERPGEIPGDVVLVVEQQEHGVFKRRGNDLFMTKKIMLYEALCGFKFLLTHLDGRQLLIQGKPGEVVKPDAVMCVKGEGMPNHKNPFISGELYIVLMSSYPRPYPSPYMPSSGRSFLSPSLPLPPHCQQQLLAGPLSSSNISRTEVRCVRTCSSIATAGGQHRSGSTSTPPPTAIGKMAALEQNPADELVDYDEEEQQNDAKEKGVGEEVVGCGN